MYGIISVETIAPGRSAMCSNADVLCIITFLVIVLVFFFFFLVKVGRKKDRVV